MCSSWLGLLAHKPRTSRSEYSDAPSRPPISGDHSLDGVSHFKYTSQTTAGSPAEGSVHASQRATRWPHGFKCTSPVSRKKASGICNLAQGVSPGERLHACTPPYGAPKDRTGATNRQAWAPSPGARSPRKQNQKAPPPASPRRHALSPFSRERGASLPGEGHLASGQRLTSGNLRFGLRSWPFKAKPRPARVFSALCCAPSRGPQSGRGGAWRRVPR
ncbi:PREDICTED: UPF0669 protein C6orf120 homolog isoform X1 [Chinchilla lanigera]|uniref:UPF0669 protein C6orf120 homolog isoform X1 n=1 Tax=Chinchilla lanigera TaxID=34839 RepID=UPI000696984A|nr:PREDICTED: UPF0669 protein C6orf120 homolog isoform X1 [Chinchilla lanigera]